MFEGSVLLQRYRTRMQGGGGSGGQQVITKARLSVVHEQGWGASSWKMGTGDVYSTVPSGADNAFRPRQDDDTDPPSLNLRSGGGTVDFQEFVAGLSAFSSRGEREEKLKCELLPSLPMRRRRS